jgi:hypothetical protein
MDHEAAEHYEKYRDELIRFASALVGPSGAEDVMTNAVVRAFSSRHWATVNERRAYLYQAVVNEARGRSLARLNFRIAGHDRGLGDLPWRHRLHRDLSPTDDKVGDWGLGRRGSDERL